MVLHGEDLSTVSVRLTQFGMPLIQISSMFPHNRANATFTPRLLNFTSARNSNAEAGPTGTDRRTLSFMGFLGRVGILMRVYRAILLSDCSSAPICRTHVPVSSVSPSSESARRHRTRWHSLDSSCLLAAGVYLECG
jgi:hypothetical protein